MEPNKTMRAWTHTRAGMPSDVLTLSQLPIPVISSPTQVLIRVLYCALNPGGSIIMQLLPFLFRSSPAVPEMDFSGIVVQVGAKVPSDRHLQIGDEVFGSIPVPQHVKSTCGALSEYVVVESSSVVPKPPGALIQDVSGLGVAGATALQVMKQAKLKKGDSVLVNGASGGIGHMLVQMCRAEVGETGKIVAVCSKKNVNWVKELGCDEVIDYELHAPVYAYLAKSYSASRFNVVIDAAGVQDLFLNCPAFLAEGKPFVTVGPRLPGYTYLSMLRVIGTMAKNFLWPTILGGVPRSYVQVTATANLEAMEELAKMVERRELRIVVTSCAEMEDAKQAYDRMLSGSKGKVVVRIQNP
ncbi:zinc alcohol dehydrogenase [Lindgomyces ingoldianus]|uniref:Zinc alcohol dehydrogenase n=1 Tax=Lindgomyces ingoldianus TaxID=673940 RepID=A0ACB6QI09_9PLEO|nr:zinc alcohol dehydrogenase [Lindgomyces ingoldianus]KAF2466223.1 zinc alcohol dehydrogenase [Lindgomyces ingoldianus]